MLINCSRVVEFDGQRGDVTEGYARWTGRTSAEPQRREALKQSARDGLGRRQTSNLL